MEAFKLNSLIECINNQIKLINELASDIEDRERAVDACFALNSMVYSLTAFLLNYKVKKLLLVRASTVDLIKDIRDEKRPLSISTLEASDELAVDLYKMLDGLDAIDVDLSKIILMTLK